MTIQLDPNQDTNAVAVNVVVLDSMNMMTIDGVTGYSMTWTLCIGII